MTFRSRITSALAIAALTAAAGCATGPDDNAIAAAVKARLSTTKAVDATKLTITSAAGVVTLAGTQTSPQEKQAAEAFTGTIAGVKGVKNMIVVKP